MSTTKQPAPIPTVMLAKQPLSVRVFLAVATLVLGLSAALAPLASAGQLVEKSISLSSSSAGAEGVSYSLGFKSVKAAEALVVDFCSNSPLVGQSCNAPAGLDVTAVSSETLGFSDTVAIDNNTLVATGAIAAGSEVAIKFDGLNNPTSSGTIYARLVTYDTKAHAQSYQSNSIGAGATDSGSVAMAITDTITFGVQVPETINFCISEQVIAENCSGVVVPDLQLGAEAEDDSYVLSSDMVSTDQIYTQLSTNALSGAVVRLTSSAAGCGGLLRTSDPSACDILPALGEDIQPGQAKFGVKTAASTGTGSNPSGVLQPFNGSVYNNNSFALNFVSDEASGVTSVYGDPFIDTNGQPANNQNMAITFGASISDQTPAGDYSTKLNLVVTGRY